MDYSQIENLIVDGDLKEALEELMKTVSPNSSNRKDIQLTLNRLARLKKDLLHGKITYDAGDRINSQICLTTIELLDDLKGLKQMTQSAQKPAIPYAVQFDKKYPPNSEIRKEFAIELKIKRLISNLVAFREKLNISESEFEHKTGISMGSLNRIESGKEIKLAELLAYCDYGLNQNMAFLIGEYLKIS